MVSLDQNFLAFKSRNNFTKILHFFETERTDQGYYRSLDFDEVFEKYKDLENIVIDDIWQKYVPVSKEGGE